MSNNQPPVTGRVKSMKSKFEQLNSLESLDISVLSVKNNPIGIGRPVHKFQRSATSIDLFSSRSRNAELSSTNISAKDAGGRIKGLGQNGSNSGNRSVPPAFNQDILKPLKEIKENVEVRLSRQTSDPAKRGSIKRSPAFRVGDKPTLKTVQTKFQSSATKTTTTVPEEFKDRFERFLKHSVDDPKILYQSGITDTLKAALKQPLPTGPPPKKPPRAFGSPKENISTQQLFVEHMQDTNEDDHMLKTKIDFLENNLKFKSNGDEIDNSKLFSNNLLSCLPCTTPIYDSILIHSLDDEDSGADDTTSTFHKSPKHTNNNKNNQSNTVHEHIYMEPFSHLKSSFGNKQSGGGGSTAIVDIIEAAADATIKNIDDDSKLDCFSLTHCSCPEKHYGRTDTHYLCTNIDDSIKSETETIASTDSEQLNSLTNTYDEINILVNAAYSQTKQMSNELTTNPLGRPKSVITLSRSLTEKRKDYVQRIWTKSVDTQYGSLQKTFKSPVFKTFSFDEIDTPIVAAMPSTRDRINQFKNLIESSNNNNTTVVPRSIAKSDSTMLHNSNTVQKKDVAIKSDDQTSDNLFQMCLLIGYNVSTNKAYIKSKYPVDATTVPDNIEQLVFPSSHLLAQGKENQDYNLVLTKECGLRLYGYCRRVLPENSDICLPLAYCLITQIKAPGFYFKILKEIEQRHGQTDVQLIVLLRTLQAHTMPERGKIMHIKITQNERQHTLIAASNAKHQPNRLSLDRNPPWLLTKTPTTNPIITDGKSKKKALSQVFDDPPFDLGLINRNLLESQQRGPISIDEILIRRPNDLRLESTGLSDLYSGLGAELLIHVFGSLLLERKVILYSKSISLLSSCVQGLETILYPFQWQYSMVTLLPQSLMEICQAPFPVLAGVLDQIQFDIEDGLLVNLDERKILQKCGDETTILPKSLRRSLRVSLDMVDILDHGKLLSNVLIAEAFLRFFVELFTPSFSSSDDCTVFEKEQFIQSHPSQSVRLFTEWFVETAMFRHFINTKYQQPSKAVNNNNTKPIIENQTNNNNDDWYALFNARLLAKSENKAPTNQNLEWIIINSKIVNEKAKTFKDRFKNLLSSN